MYQKGGMISAFYQMKNQREKQDAVMLEYWDRYSVYTNPHEIFNQYNDNNYELRWRGLTMLSPALDYCFREFFLVETAPGRYEDARLTADGRLVIWGAFRKAQFVLLVAQVRAFAACLARACADPPLQLTWCWMQRNLEITHRQRDANNRFSGEWPAVFDKLRKFFESEWDSDDPFWLTLPAAMRGDKVLTNWYKRRVRVVEDADDTVTDEEEDAPPHGAAGGGDWRDIDDTQARFDAAMAGGGGLSAEEEEEEED